MEKTLVFALINDAGKLCIVPEKADPKQLLRDVKRAIAQLTLARQGLNDIIKKATK